MTGTARLVQLKVKGEDDAVKAQEILQRAHNVLKKEVKGYAGSTRCVACAEKGVARKTNALARAQLRVQVRVGCALLFAPPPSASRRRSRRRRIQLTLFGLATGIRFIDLDSVKAYMNSDVRAKKIEPLLKELEALAIDKKVHHQTFAADDW